jgi:hypothetical protein
MMESGDERREAQVINHFKLIFYSLTNMKDDEKLGEEKALKMKGSARVKLNSVGMKY